MGRARIVVTTTPRSTRLLRDLTSRTDGSVHITVGRMWENEFLDEGMAADLRREYMGTRLGRQELEREMLGDFEGALISRDGIDRHRIPRESIPLLSRVVVGVDPAMKAGEDHDESGVIVAGEGLGPDGELHAYIIDDRSFRGTPNQVMEQVAAAVRKWEADCVVLETNQGGHWVRDTLRTVDSGIPVREVHAMKSKVLRAERVSALFEQGRIHMAGTFPELEDELCQLMPGEVPVRSPDRADAAVYAVFELRHLGQGGSWLSAYGMAACPNCKATLGAKRLKCPECGHEREPEPQPEAEPDGELKGWAAAYAPRQPANNMDRVAAVLRQYADGNFSGAGPGRTPGLSQIWKKGRQ
jgi:phage terminase large subunit-like protein